MSIFGKMFGKKKKKIEVGAPTNVQQVTGYQAVPGASDSIPVKSAFIMSCGDWTLSGNDAKLNLIGKYLEAYHKGGDAWDKAAALGQLYFLTDYWVKSHENDTESMKGRGIWSLFLTVADKLCEMFACSVNVLPQKLEEYWGRVLTPHGHHIDTQAIPTGAKSIVAQYLSRKEAEVFRISFVNGRAYQQTWWVKPPLKLVVAESARVGWTYHPSITEQMMDPGYAGFAMSMGREIYMTHHKGGFHKDNFFHSSYLAGDTVLCTGTILIVNGTVKAIRNDSGHYQPTLEHLMNVVQALEMHGVDPATVIVRAVAHSWRDGDGKLVTDRSLSIKGSELLAARGGGQGLEFRFEANKNLIGRRGGQLSG